ncbi:MAG: hypothetical protein JXA57_12475, partial [Armatimonadetes bacterium]|nr:hypothetical protein [Armatimonadota bacterium]
MVGTRPVPRNLAVAVVLIVLLGAVLAAVAVDWASAVTTKPGWRATSVGQSTPLDHPQLNGDYVVYRGPSQSELRLYQISTGTTVRIDAPGTGAITGLCKDGRYVAWSSNAGVWVYDIVTGAPARLVSSTTSYDVCLSRDRLVWGGIHVFTIPLNAQRALGQYAPTGLSLDGDYLVWQEMVARDYDIMLHDFSSDQTVNLTKSLGLGFDHNPDVAANGTVVWARTVTPGGHIWLYDRASGAARTLTSGQGSTMVSSPLTDGRWVVWSDNGDLWLADTQDVDPTASARLIVGTGDGTGGPDGGVLESDKALGGGWLVYYMAPNIWRYDLSTGLREIVANVAPEKCWNLQTDGQRIVAVVGTETPQHEPHVVRLFEQGSSTTTSSTTTTTAVPSTGFLPNPNGYQFANLAYSDPAAAKAVFTHLFGASLFDSQGAQQSLSPAGKQAYVNVSGIYAGGICFGMASTSISYFQRHLQTESITPGVTTLWGLGTFGVTQSNPSKLPATLKRTLEEYYTAQCSQTVHDTMFDSAHFVQSDTATTADKLKNLIAAIRARVAGEPVILCIWGKTGAQEEGHAIVAYRVESAADGKSGKVWVYDSNYPGVPHSVSYDLQAGSWSYPELFSQDTMIAYVPISLVYSVVDSTTPVPYFPGWVYASTACNITFADSSGHITGKTTSGYVSDNPHVRLEPLLDGRVGQSVIDRYAVSGGSARQFTLQQVGSRAAYAGSYGTAGACLVCGTGVSGDSISVSAAYSGADVSFSTASDAGV